MKTKVAIGILIVLAVVAALAGVKTLQIKTLVASGKAFVQPPESVSSVVVHEEKWPVTLTAIGSVTAVQGVTVNPELPGIVCDIAFESGQVVGKGDVLVRLDTSLEAAQLRALEAQEELARINVVRERTLRSQKMVSQSELDTAEATLKQNQANADAVRTTIEKKTIRAPFAGRLGLRMVNLGQYLDTGKPIVSLQSLNPVYADFTLPQQELAQLKTGMRVSITTDSYAGRRFEGKLTAITPDLDQSTRSVGLQATLDNPDQLLRPGMFCRVEVFLPEDQQVLVIPSTAVLSAPFGDSVYVIESRPATNGAPAGLVVRQQFVRTGRTHGDFLTVETGLKAGERIVSAGIFKLRNGMSVTENNDVAPKHDMTPRPPDT
ncbi:MAG TPA: efflux RND transporter periplasmic adaptor subunit [Candidatus Acidoferrum sp.]|nr:efflux RND transporter periplasmic adaptor subunit [Candidatus Acidoferrum sp.]